MLDFSQLKLAIRNLKEQYENFCSLNENLPQITRDGVKESVIQRFEICYDILWKMLKKYLTKTLKLADVPSSPNPVFRIANDNKLLPNALSNWLEYAEIRTETTHEYGAEIVDNAIEKMNVFIGDCIKLYEKISGERWEKLT